MILSCKRNPAVIFLLCSCILRPPQSSLAVQTSLRSWGGIWRSTCKSWMNRRQKFFALAQQQEVRYRLVGAGLREWGSLWIVLHEESPIYFLTGSDQTRQERQRAANYHAACLVRFVRAIEFSSLSSAKPTRTQITAILDSTKSEVNVM